MTQPKQSFPEWLVRTLLLGSPALVWQALKIWSCSNPMNNPEMSQSQQPREVELKILYVLIFLLLSAGSIPVLRSGRV